MSKRKGVIAMGDEVEDENDDDYSPADGGRKRKSTPRSPDQDSSVPQKSMRLHIEQDLNRSPIEEIEAPNPEPEPLFEKKLTKNDIRQRMMLISGYAHKDRVFKALRDDEREKARGIGGLSVVTTDTDGVEYKMQLEADYFVALTEQWSLIRKKHKLKAGDSVMGFGSRGDDDKFRLRLQYIIT